MLRLCVLTITFVSTFSYMSKDAIKRMFNEADCCDESESCVLKLGSCQGSTVTFLNYRAVTPQGEAVLETFATQHLEWYKRTHYQGYKVEPTTIPDGFDTTAWQVPHCANGACVGPYDDTKTMGENWATQFKEQGVPRVTFENVQWVKQTLSDGPHYTFIVSFPTMADKMAHVAAGNFYTEIKEVTTLMRAACSFPAGSLHEIPEAGYASLGAQFGPFFSDAIAACGIELITPIDPSAHVIGGVCGDDKVVPEP